MFCALHVLVAFGVLLVVCSLARANTVRLRVQFRPSSVLNQSFIQASVAGVFLSCVSSLYFSLSSKPASKSFGPSSVAIFRPSRPSSILFLFFSLLPSPRVLASFPAHWNSLLSACVPRCSLSAAPALEKSPPGFSPSFIRFLALQRCKPKPPRAISPACVPQERE